MNELIYVTILVVTYFGYKEIKKLNKKLDEIEDRAITRHQLFEDWIFQSLYSLNNKVLLPTEHEQSTINKPATVFSPTQDGQAEFNGLKDDWHE